MSPEALVELIDFRHISDAITPADALSILQKAQSSRVSNEKVLLEKVYLHIQLRPVGSDIVMKQ